MSLVTLERTCDSQASAAAADASYSWILVPRLRDNHGVRGAGPLLRSGRNGNEREAGRSGEHAASGTRGTTVRRARGWAICSSRCTARRLAVAAKGSTARWGKRCAFGKALASPRARAIAASHATDRLRVACTMGAGRTPPLDRPSQWGKARYTPASLRRRCRIGTHTASPSPLMPLPTQRQPHRVPTIL